MIDSNSALIAEFRHKGRPDLSAFYTVFMIFDAYYTMNKPEWIDMENQEYRNATEKHFAEYYKTHKKTWETFPYQEKMNISQGIRGRSVHEGMSMEALTGIKGIGKVKAMQLKCVAELSVQVLLADIQHRTPLFQLLSPGSLYPYNIKQQNVVQHKRRYAQQEELEYVFIEFRQ